ncbi:hypothetical protein ABPG75_007317 [Micractinium tetrahymenae]
MQALYQAQPCYDLAPGSGLRALDMQGWSPGASLYERLLEEVDAVTVIEVGVWKGLSAAHMARWLKRKGQGVLVAVDTWLGAPEFWSAFSMLGHDEGHNLSIVHGYPSVFFTFLSNMVHLGLQDAVVPLPQTSQTASVILLRLGVMEVDLVHIDAAHEWGPCRQDIHIWWPFVRAGGILLGDDWTPGWPGVQKASWQDAWVGVGAVLEFVVLCELNEYLKIEGIKWMIHKPPAEWFAARPLLPAVCTTGQTDHYPEHM